MLVAGEEIPPPILKFKDMRFPEPILEKLKMKEIKQPTPIQAQGLLVALSRRDMIGVAFTGSRKMLVFVLPLIMHVVQEETQMPIAGGEGPFALSFVPPKNLHNKPSMW